MKLSGSVFHLSGLALYYFYGTSTAYFIIVRPGGQPSSPVFTSGLVVSSSFSEDTFGS